MPTPPPGEVARGFCRNLIGHFVVAGAAAGFAVHQAVGTDTNIDDRLTETAILLTLTLRFRLFTLRAAILRGTGRSAHAVECTAVEADVKT